MLLSFSSFDKHLIGAYQVSFTGVEIFKVSLEILLGLIRLRFRRISLLRWFLSHLLLVA